MSKKVKCISCVHSLGTSMPSEEYINSHMMCYDYLKDRFLNCIICEITMKTKHRNNEQYCKNYREEDDFHKYLMEHTDQQWYENFKAIEEMKQKEKYIEENQKK